MGIGGMRGISGKPIEDGDTNVTGKRKGKEEVCEGNKGRYAGG